MRRELPVTAFKAFIKFQITNPNDQTNSKPQISKSQTTQRPTVFGTLIIEFWNLFGSWCLKF
jgi:hypothetical protein